MKIVNNIMLILLMSFAVVACEKDDDGGGNVDAENAGVLTASVNGISFSGSVITKATESAIGGNTFITLQGSDDAGKAITITLTNFIGSGTYEFFSGNTVVNTASYLEANSSDPTASKTWVAPYADSGVVGKVIVTEKTDIAIMGTFSFKGKEQAGTSFREIVDGRFNLEF